MPSVHLRWMIFLLKSYGIWGIDSSNRTLQRLYAVGAVASRLVFFYFSVFVQVVALFHATNVTVSERGQQKIVHFLICIIFVRRNSLKDFLFWSHSPMPFTRSTWFWWIWISWKCYIDEPIVPFSSLEIVRKKSESSLIHHNHNQNVVVCRILNETMGRAKFHGVYYLSVGIPVAIVYAMVLFVLGKHIYNAWYPIDASPSNSFNFYATIAHEILSSVVVGMMNVSTDVFLFLFMGMIEYQIRLLGHRLMQLGWTDGVEGENHYRKLVECVRLRQEINGFVV